MSKNVIISAVILTLAAAAPALSDKGGNGHGNGKGNKHGNGHAAFCPPGLAKKGNGCQPPGQAKKHATAPIYKVEPAPVTVVPAPDRVVVTPDGTVYAYRVGEYIRQDYVVIRDPSPYGLDPAGTYWRVGEEVYRMDGDTGRVLATLGVLTALLE